MSEIPSVHINPSIGSRFTSALIPAPLVQIITGGLVTGLLQVVLSISYATLVFRGELSPYVGQGIGFALVGAFIISTVVSLFSSLPGTVGSNQDVSVAIFSLISASIVANMPPGASPEEAFCTLVTAIALTTLLTGLFFLCLGVFQLGGLVRYLPYPVVGGFLAGTGWLLFKGGFFLMNGTVTYLNLFNPAYIGHWLPGLLLAVIMFKLSKQIQSSFILPSLILGGTFIFFTVAWLMGHLPAELSLQGWLLGPFDDRTLWRPLSFTQIRMADWHVIVGQSANITTVMMVSSLSILLNASGLELVAKKDIDLNKELRTTGIGNLLSGLSPGYIGFMQISLTALNFKMNARSRMVGMIAVTLIGLAIAFGASIIVYFPKMIMGAVLMYLGMTFLYDWIYKTWFALPGIDIFIIWMILIVIAVFGFLPGIAIGFMAAVIMFAISCSHTEVVRHELTGKSNHSRVTRPINQRQVLDREGDKLYILKLQGFIFFGTADRLFNKIKQKCQIIKDRIR